MRKIGSIFDCVSFLPSEQFAKLQMALVWLLVREHMQKTNGEQAQQKQPGCYSLRVPA